jgi:hypothetical protein
LIASSVDAAFSAQRKARALAPEPSPFSGTGDPPIGEFHDAIILEKLGEVALSEFSAQRALCDILLARPFLSCGTSSARSELTCPAFRRWEHHDGR